MSKIETFKNDRIDFDMFAGAMIFIAFKRKFGVSINNHLAKDSSDVEALSFIIFEAYKSACYLKNAETKHSIEDIMNRLDLFELLECFYLLFPSEDQKKTKVK